MRLAHHAPCRSPPDYLPAYQAATGGQDRGRTAAAPPTKCAVPLWVGLGPCVGLHSLLTIWYRAGRPGASLVGTVLLSLALASLATAANVLVQVLIHLVAVLFLLVLGSRTA